MKLWKKSLERDNSGELKLYPEDAEDMWYVYNIVQEGDEIEASTTRKVVNEKGNSRIHLTLCIRVIKIEYDAESNVLRLNGKTCKDHKEVHIGSFHTLQLSAEVAFSIYKNEWDSFALSQVEEATNIENRSDIAAVVLQPGIAHLCLVTDAMTVLRHKVDVNIPRKKRGDNAAQDKAMERFFTEVYTSISSFINLDKIKAILIAGPGNTPRQCYDFIFQKAQSAGNQPIIKSKSKFLTGYASSGHLHSLQEALNDPSVRSQLADTRYGREMKVMDQFFKNLNEDDMRAWYGPEEVQKAADLGAVETLMITDSLFRSSDLRERKMYVDLVDKVKEDGKEVLVFSSLHPSGEQLDGVSGIACLLLYPLDLDQEDEADDENQED